MTIETVSFNHQIENLTVYGKAYTTRYDKQTGTGGTFTVTSLKVASPTLSSPPLVSLNAEQLDALVDIGFDLGKLEQTLYENWVSTLGP